MKAFAAALVFAALLAGLGTAASGQEQTFKSENSGHPPAPTPTATYMWDWNYDSGYWYYPPAWPSCGTNSNNWNSRHCRPPKPPSPPPRPVHHGGGKPPGRPPV